MVASGLKATLSSGSIPFNEAVNATIQSTANNTGQTFTALFNSGSCCSTLMTVNVIN